MIKHLDVMEDRKSLKKKKNEDLSNLWIFIAFNFCEFYKLQSV